MASSVPEINTTPLIDVLLVLLVLLVITLPHSTHRVSLNLPGGPPSGTPVSPPAAGHAVAARSASAPPARRRRHSRQPSRAR